MKWHNYTVRWATSPIAVAAIRDICSSKAAISTAELKSFVTEILDYVAFRPLRALPLDVTMTIEIGDSIKGYYAHQRSWKAVCYTIYFKVGVESGFRARNVRDGETLGEALAETQTWYNSCAEKIGPLHDIYIVRYTGRGGPIGRTYASLEIFQVKENSFELDRTSEGELHAEVLDLAREIVNANLAYAGITRTDLENGTYRYPCGCWAEDGHTCGL